MNSTFIAVDFGASNGRVIAGHVHNSPEGKELLLEEIYRFPNRPVKIGDYLYWDFPALFAEMKKGLAIAAARFPDIISIGIDTWGVDFGLIDRLGNMVGNPICYRDQHTTGEVEEFFKSHDVSKHYAETGIQILPINTLFRLSSMVHTDDPKLKIARHLLFMPDMFAYYLTGKPGNEYTIASTSELLLAEKRQWNVNLIKSIGVDPSLFGEILMPGTVRGNLLKEVCSETGLPESVKVVAVGSHDTASAVFAMADDYSSGNTAFLSSGTWSLLGVLLDHPVLSEKARLADYTNEGGVGGKIRLLTNITGLWILQQLVAQWEKTGEKINWDDIIAQGEAARDTAIIDVDDPVFQNPDGMEENIKKHCKERNLECPQTRGEFVRCVCKSLAIRYKMAIENLNSLLPNPIGKLIIFGGGSKNRLLTKLTSEVTGLEIEVKEAEATAMGNIIVQALAHGSIKDKHEITKTIFL